jgi:hypothetical protein
MPAPIGRLGFHPATLLKIYLYSDLNQVQWSRRLEREAGRNVEWMWLTRRLATDFKTIADFRRDNGDATQATCRSFVVLCRQLGLLAGGVVAVDGSRFKAVNTRVKNFTPAAVRHRIEQVEARIRRWTPPTARRARRLNCARPKLVTSCATIKCARRRRPAVRCGRPGLCPWRASGSVSEICRSGTVATVFSITRRSRICRRSDTSLSFRRSNPTSMRLPSLAAILAARRTGSGLRRCGPTSST